MHRFSSIYTLFSLYSFFIILYLSHFNHKFLLPGTNFNNYYAFSCSTKFLTFSAASTESVRTYR